MAENTLALMIETLSDKTIETLSQAAELAERHEDMVTLTMALVQRKLSAEEILSADLRNMLSVAFKNVVGGKRSSLRILNEELQFDAKPDIVEKFKKQVEHELESTSKEVLDLLGKLTEQNETRIASAGDADKDDLVASQVFYLKMSGDYYRYLAEAFKSNNDYKEKCNKHYNAAMELAKENMPPTHPTRLGLALNYSVCHYEILEQPEEACALAKAAFDEAIEKLDSLNDSSYKDSTLIMQLLRDNLTIWRQSDFTEDNMDEE